MSDVDKLFLVFFTHLKHTSYVDLIKTQKSLSETEK